MMKRQTIWPCVYTYKARKEYKCDICGETIPLRELYGKRVVGNKHYHLRCMMNLDAKKNRNRCLYCHRKGKNPVYDQDQHGRKFIRGYVCEIHGARTQ